MVKEIFIRLCNEKGVSPTKACANIGISSAAFSQWTDATVPRKATLMRMADYFGVTIDYLLGKTEETKKSPSVSDEDIKFALFGGEGEITDEMYDEVKQFAAFVKAKHKKK